MNLKFVCHEGFELAEEICHRVQGYHRRRGIDLDRDRGYLWADGDDQANRWISSWFSVISS